MIGEVSNREEIIREVVKRTGVERDKIEFIFDFTFSFIKKLTKKRHVLTIFLPHLGRLYQKNGYLRREEAILSSKEELTRGEAIRLSRAKDKIKLLEETGEPGTSKNKYHYTLEKIKNRHLTNGKTIEELELFQNGKEE